MNALNRLAAIAEELDERGMIQAADILTDVMRRVAQQTPQEVVNMAPSFNAVGKYDESAWRQAFSDKYNRFVQIVQSTKDTSISMDSSNPGIAQGLYEEMMYIASNYLKDDPGVFQAMKWVVPTYKGLFT